MNTLWIALLVLVVIVRRQLTPKPLSARVVIFPLVLIVLGAYEASNSGRVDVVSCISLALSLILGLIAGLLAGRFTHVYRQNGQWTVVGSLMSIAVWILSLPIRYGIKLLVVSLLGAPPTFSGQASFVPYVFSIGGILIGQAVMVLLRHPDTIKTLMSGIPQNADLSSNDDSSTLR